ncbi:hypothetical protein SCHPADRAFT_13366 [Schizopora paradoxa]|uniref:C2H2-type domain-containing protein n=1 Tax=Schizopora paradoxa TaxID=27342 RepID=A0A0H2S8N3_9AGAM|nr:hypothetical protein SCHPADRAFT_13366 [Schizopora paradoxa]
MVRKHSSEQTTEGKRNASKKASSSAATWACDLGRCDKKFAREADLRRHQRTAKVHVAFESKLSHPCPQCTSSFTRTDALKRHQKTRHNGIIIKSSSMGMRDPDAVQQTSVVSGSSSQNRATSTRISEGADGASNSAIISTDTSVSPSDEPGLNSGSQSYYRRLAHDTSKLDVIGLATPAGNVTSSVFVHSPDSAGALINSLPSQEAGFSEQVGSSSSSRHWPPAPPWIQESPGRLQNDTGPYYRPGSYYRTPDGLPIPPEPAAFDREEPAQQQGGASRSELKSISKSPRGPQSEDTKDGDTRSASSRSRSSVPIADNPCLESQRTSSPIPTTDRISVNVAVQRALQAMLAIDPSLGNMPSLQSSDETGHPAPPVSFQVPLSAFAALANSVNIDHNEDRRHYDANAIAVTATSTANTSSISIADTDGNMEVGLNVSTSENGTPILRPDEILNEDSFI